MDEQRYSQRVRIGLIVLGAIFVAMGFFPAAEWFAGAIGLVR
jgi:hypothetical protein